MPLRQKRIVLSAKIENSISRQNKGDYLRRGKSNDEKRAEKVETIASKIILHNLPADMKEIFGISLETRIMAVRDGSIIFFFEIILAGYNIISNYKSFFESIELIEMSPKMVDPYT